MTAAKKMFELSDAFAAKQTIPEAKKERRNKTLSRQQASSPTSLPNYKQITELVELIPFLLLDNLEPLNAALVCVCVCSSCPSVNKTLSV